MAFRWLEAWNRLGVFLPVDDLTIPLYRTVLQSYDVVLPLVLDIGGVEVALQRATSVITGNEPRRVSVVHGLILPQFAVEVHRCQWTQEGWKGAFRWM